MRALLITLLFDTQAFCGEVQYVELKNGYKVYTERAGGGQIKILTLHGGPGCSHDYLKCLQDHLPADKYQLIFYDQLGSYYSDKPNDRSLWTLDRFCDEVEEVRRALGLSDFYLYGQSWGALLAIEYSLKYPHSLKGLILSNITASISSYESYINELKMKLPQEIQEKLTYYEERKEYANPQYEKLMFEEVYSRHVCRLKEWPKAVLCAFERINPTIYQTIQGPNEFVILGNIKPWNRWSDLHRIHVPTMIICGRYDTMNPADSEKMGRLIPHATVKICENGSHLAMYDDAENYFQALRLWLDNC